MLLPSLPAEPLRPFVRAYVHTEISLPRSSLYWSIPARSWSVLEFTFGNPYRIHHVDGSRVETTFASTVVGPKSYRRVRLELRENVETFVILFQPAGLQLLFSLPAKELVNEHYEAHAVLGPAAGRLRSRLGEAASFRERVSIADQFLKARLARVSRLGGTEKAANEILANRGCIRVPDLARQAGLGIRQLERRFVHQFGMTPKLYARVVRFETALEQKLASPRTDWTSIAHGLGYFDQMHMVHDFERLSGDTPTTVVEQFRRIATAGRYGAAG